VDVRLNNVSQLAGFAKKGDIEYFLQALVGAAYVHDPLLAPTPDLLKAYRARTIPWSEYERRFNELLVQRRIDRKLDASDFASTTVLLCSERSPKQCHRRLVAEYLQRTWDEVSVNHL
jgi:uncharacterized protein (DUF488 family)